MSVVDYRCEKCGAEKCKLWRMASTSHVELLCAICSADEQKEDISDIDKKGRHINRNGMRTDHIGNRIPAVPDLDGTWWLSGAAPVHWAAWWKALPTLSGVKQ